MTGPADLADLFGPPPAGPSQAVRYRQGVITAFNPATLENTVSVGGAILTDVAMLGVAEAASLTVGSVVGLLLLGDVNGATTWTIVGRIVTPNTPDAIEAITQLARNVRSAEVTTSESPGSLNVWLDLATLGPFVQITVGASRAVVVIASAIVALTDTGVLSEAGFFGLTASGVNTIDPNTSGLPAGQAQIVKSAVGQTLTVTVAAQWTLTGLTPGDTTFGLKYIANGGTPAFAARNITVIVL